MRTLPAVSAAADKKFSSKKRLEKYQNTHTRQTEHSAKQWEARQSKVQNNFLREEWLENQTAHKYHAEHDRIKGWMSHYRPPYAVPQQLRDRETFLHGLVGPHLPR